MFLESPTPAEDPVLGSALVEAVEQRYGESGAEGYGISLEYFRQIVTAVVRRYGGESAEAEQVELVATLHVSELVMARACSAGNDAAWGEFLARYRASLHATACRITRDQATGRELADGLYGDLYGIPNQQGKRVSKLDYYMGRGSFEGWLRTVLTQQYIDRYRSHSKEVSLDEQIEAGVSFADHAAAPAAQADDCLTAAVRQELSALENEERFLLASYFLDERTLANIARQLRVHESTISRRLERLTVGLRKRVRKRLLGKAIDPRRCEEMLKELDVRDLNIDVGASLGHETSGQKTQVGTFLSREMDK